MTANTIYSTVHKLGLDTTQSSQGSMVSLEPLRRGIILARECSIDYDKLYDIYELHELGEQNRKGKRYYDHLSIMQRDLTLESKEDISNIPIECQCLMQTASKSKRTPIFEEFQLKSVKGNRKIAILSPQNLINERESQEQSSIYYTCRSHQSQA